jgi:oligopeptide transport system ATP-binding protein
MIFQDPMASLNERAKVDYIVSEGLLNLPEKMSKEERERTVAKLSMR